ncbi:blastula protease 10-like [Amphiura filiformis]|uniref:blastula protease 10-like n=1 Tax=Amphiura filiformis TaxID=82378 RepID=UPI003B216307
MKFVFALALVAVCVMLMHARPNVQVQKRAADSAHRLLKRSDGNSDNNHHHHGNGQAGNPKEGKGRKRLGEKAEDLGEVLHDEETKTKGENKDAEKEAEEELEELVEEEKEEEKELDRQKRAQKAFSATLWDKTEICYTFDPPSYAQRMKDGRTLEVIVNNAVKEIERKTGLKIQYKQGASGCIIIHNGQGCWSWIGKQDNSKRDDEVVLQDDLCFTHGVVLHEIFHALGMAHEATRSDADATVKVNMGNVQPGMESQFEKSSHTILNKDGNVDGYDVCSIMQYGPNAFSMNGANTIDVKDPKNKVNLDCMGSQIELSLRDGEVVAGKYGTLDEDATDCKNGGYMLIGESKCVCSNLFPDDDFFFFNPG